MPDHPAFRKVFPAVASRAAMFALINRHNQAPFDDHRISGALYAGERFEVDEPQHDEMLNLLPPLFLRPGMFAMSSLNGGKVAIVFVTMPITGRQRWFMGFCDLSVPNSPEMLRDAVIARETRHHADRLSREEKLEVIRNATPSDLRGYAPIQNAAVQPPRRRDRRKFLIDGGGSEAAFCFLEALTAEQIEERLPADLTRLAAIEESGSPS